MSDTETELREALSAAVRLGDRLQKAYRALTAEVITGLTAAGHEKVMAAGLPFCRCGLSLAGGDASGSFITHALAVLRDERSGDPAPGIKSTPDSLRPSGTPRRGDSCPVHGGTLLWLGDGRLMCEHEHGYQIPAPPPPARPSRRRRPPQREGGV